MKYIFFIIIITVCCFIILVDSLYLSKRGEALTMIDDSTTIAESYNKTFHESAEDIQQQLNVYIPPLQNVNVLDDNGNSIQISIPKYLGTYTYYTPGTYKYNASSYIPSYEDSIYLSRSIGVVPKLNSEFYIPSSDYRLNSIETPFSESDELISTSSDWVNEVRVKNQIQPEESDNVNFAKTDNKLPELTNSYNMDKSDEVIAYENKANDLLNIQKKILSYATLAPLNIQPKIISPDTMDKNNTTDTPITNTPIKGTPDPMIEEKNYILAHQFQRRIHH
jgi:uncharacterized protein YpmS